ncbi:hypothetical protein EV421DRAFT_1911288 [Armillaria borealis]|uniref:Uncharacterized protein n=1 Tax=Armillaria borealis TaxID=47425 RepID=A0AA39MEN4_9AGAR|nr:hypothetical protein EV421DRAFT_1911288 [Armillaria borealis]
MPALQPSLNDFLVFCDKYGKEEDGDSKDIVKSWSRSKQEFTTPVLEHFQELQKDVYGEDDAMTDTKAVLVDREYHGGIALEHSFRSEFHVRNAQRAYHLTTSFQEAHGLEAPHRSNKADGIKEKDHENTLRQHVNELAVHTANEGLCKGAPDTLEIMEQWADLANFPKTGYFNRYKGFSTSMNNCWPASQTNFASSQRGNQIPMDATVHESRPVHEEADETEQEGTKNLKKNIGKYSGNHGDGGDHLVIPMAMTNLTHPHPDVSEECFCLTEFGIVWVLEEFSTLYFSGLHMHGGGLPQYNAFQTDKSIYTRVTVILYPPQVTLNGEFTLAFAALPYPPDPCRVCQKRDKKERQMQSDKGKGKEKHRTETGRNPLKAALLKLPTECMHQLSIGRHYTEQATYLSDGGSFLAPKDHFNHGIRSLMQWISGIIQQFPPQYFVHFDRDLLLSAFSMELEGTRIAVEPWNLGPGWSGSDVLIGLQSNISVEDMTEEQIGQCWNTNNLNCSAPYGNHNIERVEERFYTLAEEMGRTIPLNIGALEKMERPLGGRPHIADPQAKRKYIQQVRHNDGSKGSMQKRSRPKAKKPNLEAEDHRMCLIGKRLDWEGSYKSALVVQFFVDHLGAKAVLLDLQKFDLSTPLKVMDLKTVIMNSPIYHVGSVERLLLRQVARVSGAPDQDNLIAILSRMPRCTITEYNNQSLPFFGEQDTSTFPSSSTHLTSLISGGPSHVASLPSSPQSSSSNVPSEFNICSNLKWLKLMFELSYLLLDNLSEPYSPFNTTPKLTLAARNFITYVAADTDTQSIFRDLASSRTQSLRSGGPFDLVNLQTSAGFFSALMGRGVLHRTEYLKDSNNPVFFIDENHWKTIRNESLGHKAEGYFCNKWAYSNQPNNK